LAHPRQETVWLTALHAPIWHRGAWRLPELNRVVTNGAEPVTISRNDAMLTRGLLSFLAPEQDYPGGPLAGIELQETVERRLICSAAPVHRGSRSATLSRVSRPPHWVEPSHKKTGIKLGDLALALLDFAIIREAPLALKADQRFPDLCGCGAHHIKLHPLSAAAYPCADMQASPCAVCTQ
jgi:hypothetical protein